MTFPAYPAYKDSGVEWLGDVPEHWEVGSLRRLIKSVGNGTTADQVDEAEDTVAVSRIETISAGLINFEKVGHVGPQDVARRFLLNAGDILFSHINSLSMVGNVAIYSGGRPLLHGMNLLRIQPLPSISSEWLLYWLKTKNVRQEVESRAKPAINQASISTDSVRALPALIPPSYEQTQIARFLDHETARIDALIEEQQRLIELLKEKRRGIVLSALSDTSLPLVRIGHAVDVISRPVKQREDESYTPIGLFNRDRGLFHKEPREMQDMGDSDFFWIKSGDLIISGQFAWEGAVAMAGESEEGLVVSHRYPVLRGKHGVANTEYLYAILTTKHGDFLLNESSRGAAGRNRPLNLAALLKEKIRIPSKEIQEQVSNLVQNEAKVLTECRQQISLLQERRSALISAAVTGKIDVRGWQPPANTPDPKSAVAEAN